MDFARKKLKQLDFLDLQEHFIAGLQMVFLVCTN